MSQNEQILFANEAFYLAFGARDLAAMDAVWDRQGPVCCVHPGWRPINDRDAVMESWKGIFTSDGEHEVRSAQAKLTQHADVALVTCYELLATSYMVATNIFVRREGGWRMIHHHAGACFAGRPNDEAAGLSLQ